ncbi:protein kinase domain-containing protein [Dokdonella sp.]|uniref:serine/threonine-protein kinase n=1 Tax=Dokdonella sp. TaxID=2291710 RepID=UPI003C31E174
MSNLPDSEHWQQLDNALRSVLEIDVDEREAWVTAHCADNPGIGDELRRLLGYSDKVGALDQLGHSRWMADALDSLPGEVNQVADWRILERIGAGGMAEVFLAERDSAGVCQRAALKRMAGELGSAHLTERFQRERQILARLSDARIARYMDGGIDPNGRPWLAMEYIDGTPIDSYCASRELGLRSRLRLFIELCGAVAHAHRHLVVHRDIKPSNVMVSNDGQIKLLDFGIAKALEVEDIEATRTSSRILTPRYASPEQLSGDPASTLTDVYLLGLLLFELIAGERPFADRESDPFLLEKALREDAPPPPSHVLSRRQRAGTGSNSSIAAAEARGDIDAIVLKALRSEPGQRYASVSELAADLERHLQLLPVQARRGGWRYRASRYFRRHSFATIVSALALLALLSGLFIALYQRDLARIEADKSERVLEFMVDNFRIANPSRTEGASISARELLDRGAARIPALLAEAPTARADLLDAMSEAYAGLSLYEEALSLADTSIPLRRDAGNPVLIARSVMLRASALKSLTRNDEAAQALAQARMLLPEMDDSAQASAVKARMLSLSALLHLLDKEYPQARSEWSQALAIYRRLYGPLDERTIDSALMLSRVLASQEDFEDSMRILNEIIEPLRRVVPQRPARLHEALNALGGAQNKRGDHAGAEATHREAAVLAEQVFGSQHFYVAIEQHNIGKALLQQNRADDARAPLRRALEIAEEALPPTHGLSASILMNLSLAEAGAGDCSAARTYHQRLLDLLAENPAARGVDSERTAEQIQQCNARLAAAR